MPVPSHAALSPAAADLLSLLAALAPAPFPVEALAAAEPLPPSLATDADRADAVRELEARTLVHLAPEGVLARPEAARAVVPADPAVAARVVAAAFPREPEQPEALPLASALLPHALAAADACDADRFTAARCRILAGRTLLAQGHPRAAAAALERALADVEASRGDRHPAVAVALTYLNGALLALGETTGVIPNAARALGILQEVHGPRHREVVAHANNLGTLLRGAGDPVRAVDVFRHALDAAEEAFGAGHPMTATIHGNLGITLAVLGDGSEARQHLARALAIDEAAYGPAHPSVARDLHRLGRVLADTGERDAARELMQRAIDYLQPHAGEDDPRVRALREEIRDL